MTRLYSTFAPLVALTVLALGAARATRCAGQEETILLYDSNVSSARFTPKEETRANAIRPATYLANVEEGRRLAEDEFELVPAQKSAPTVLVDMRHAHDFSDFPLTVDDRFYHRIYSFNKAFAYLRAQGVRVEKYESQEPLELEKLREYQTLFLNLPSGDKEPFLVSEILAIKRYVEEGGAVFFIVDHTNCYFHQSRLTPLFHELDIAPQFYGVCDREHRLGDGEGWLYFNDFEEHEITRGLREIAFQTGGGVDPKDAVAWSSPTSWQDAPGMPIYGEADLAYYGNFTRDENERQGASGIVLAKEFGRGRIAIVGDQNLFSSFFLQYLDGYRLWINAFAWLLQTPELADLDRYAAHAQQSDVIICWEDLRPGAKRFGDPDASGYYHIYTILCRYYNPFCIARADTEERGKVAVIIGGDEDYQPESFEFAYEQLARGDALVALDPPSDVWLRPKTELAALLDKLEENGVHNDRDVTDDETTRSSIGIRKFVERITLSNGGSITLVRGRYSYDNSTVPKPEGKLLMLDQENISALLQEINSLLQRAQ